MQYSNEEVNFLDTTIGNRVVVGVVALMISSISKGKQLAPIVMQCMKCFVPTTDNAPWLLKSLTDKTKFDGMKVPLTETKTFKLSVVAKAQKASNALTVALPPAPGRKRAKAKAKRAPPMEDMPTVVENDSGRRGPPG